LFLNELFIQGLSQNVLQLNNNNNNIINVNNSEQQQKINELEEAEKKYSLPQPATHSLKMKK